MSDGFDEIQKAVGNNSSNTQASSNNSVWDNVGFNDEIGQPTFVELISVTQKEIKAFPSDSVQGMQTNPTSFEDAAEFEFALSGSSNHYLNFGGENEKWIIGNWFAKYNNTAPFYDSRGIGRQYYYITPGGDLLAWDHSSGGPFGNKLSGTLVSVIGTKYYNNVKRLVRLIPEDQPLVSGVVEAVPVPKIPSSISMPNVAPMSGSVLLPLSAHEEVSFRIAVTDESGRIISSINKGDDYYIRAFVQDIRDGVGDDGGVFAAYLDIAYDGNLTEDKGIINHSSPYDNIKGGKLKPGKIDHTGGICGLTPVGADEFEIFNVQMTAVKPGKIVFTGSVKQDLTPFATLLYGKIIPVSGDLIRTLSTEVVVNSVFDPQVFSPLSALDDSGVKVIKVNSLAADDTDPDYKEGDITLHHAITTPGERIIVFEVGGVIDLRKSSRIRPWPLIDPDPACMVNLVVSEPNCVIAGETAPSPGITIIGNMVEIAASNVLIRHIAIRPGHLAGLTQPSFHAITFQSNSARTRRRGDPLPDRHENVLIDHCSLSWSVASVVYVDRFSYVTIQNSIIAEGLEGATGYARGLTIRGGAPYGIHIKKCVFAHLDNRSPFSIYNSSIDEETSAICTNSIIYNPQKEVFHSRDEANSDAAGPKVSALGNIVIPGLNTQPWAKGEPPYGLVGTFDLMEKGRPPKIPYTNFTGLFFVHPGTTQNWNGIGTQPKNQAAAIYLEDNELISNDNLKPRAGSPEPDFSGGYDADVSYDGRFKWQRFPHNSPSFVTSYDDAANWISKSDLGLISSTAMKTNDYRAVLDDVGMNPTRSSFDASSKTYSGGDADDDRIKNDVINGTGYLKQFEIGYQKKWDGVPRRPPVPPERQGQYDGTLPWPGIEVDTPSNLLVVFPSYNGVSREYDSTTLLPIPAGPNGDLFVSQPSESSDGPPLQIGSSSKWAVSEQLKSAVYDYVDAVPDMGLPNVEYSGDSLKSSKDPVTDVPIKRINKDIGTGIAILDDVGIPRDNLAFKQYNTHKTSVYSSFNSNGTLLLCEHLPLESTSVGASGNLFVDQKNVEHSVNKGHPYGAPSGRYFARNSALISGGKLSTAYPSIVTGAVVVVPPVDLHKGQFADRIGQVIRFTSGGFFSEFRVRLNTLEDFGGQGYWREHVSGNMHVEIVDGSNLSETGTTLAQFSIAVDQTTSWVSLSLVNGLNPNGIHVSAGQTVTVILHSTGMFNFPDRGALTINQPTYGIENINTVPPFYIFTSNAPYGASGWPDIDDKYNPIDELTGRRYSAIINRGDRIWRSVDTYYPNAAEIIADIEVLLPENAQFDDYDFDHLPGKGYDNLISRCKVRRAEDSAEEIIYYSTLDGYAGITTVRNDAVEFGFGNKGYDDHALARQLGNRVSDNSVTIGGRRHVGFRFNSEADIGGKEIVSAELIMYMPPSQLDPENLQGDAFTHLNSSENVGLDGKWYAEDSNEPDEWSEENVYLHEFKVEKNASSGRQNAEQRMDGDQIGLVEVSSEKLRFGKYKDSANNDITRAVGFMFRGSNITDDLVGRKIKSAVLILNTTDDHDPNHESFVEGGDKSVYGKLYGELNSPIAYPNIDALDSILESDESVLGRDKTSFSKDLNFEGSNRAYRNFEIDITQITQEMLDNSESILSYLWVPDDKTLNGDVAFRTIVSAQNAIKGENYAPKLRIIVEPGNDSKLISKRERTSAFVIGKKDKDRDDFAGEEYDGNHLYALQRVKVDVTSLISELALKYPSDLHHFNLFWIDSLATSDYSGSKSFHSMGAGIDHYTNPDAMEKQHDGTYRSYGGYAPVGPSQPWHTATPFAVDDDKNNKHNDNITGVARNMLGNSPWSPELKISFKEENGPIQEGIFPYDLTFQALLASDKVKGDIVIYDGSGSQTTIKKIEEDQKNKQNTNTKGLLVKSLKDDLPPGAYSGNVDNEVFDYEPLLALDSNGNRSFMGYSIDPKSIKWMPSDFHVIDNYEDSQRQNVRESYIDAQNLVVGIRSTDRRVLSVVEINANNAYPFRGRKSFPFYILNCASSVPIHKSVTLDTGESVERSYMAVIGTPYGSCSATGPLKCQQYPDSSPNTHNAWMRIVEERPIKATGRYNGDLWLYIINLNSILESTRNDHGEEVIAAFNLSDVTEREVFKDYYSKDVLTLASDPGTIHVRQDTAIVNGVDYFVGPDEKSLQFSQDGKHVIIKYAGVDVQGENRDIWRMFDVSDSAYEAQFVYGEKPVVKKKMVQRFTLSWNVSRYTRCTIRKGPLRPSNDRTIFAAFWATEFDGVMRKNASTTTISKFEAYMSNIFNGQDGNGDGVEDGGGLNYGDSDRYPGGPVEVRFVSRDKTYVDPSIPAVMDHGGERLNGPRNTVVFDVEWPNGANVSRHHTQMQDDALQGGNGRGRCGKTQYRFNDCYPKPYAINPSELNPKDVVQEETGGYLNYGLRPHNFSYLRGSLPKLLNGKATDQGGSLLTNGGDTKGVLPLDQITALSFVHGQKFLDTASASPDQFLVISSDSWTDVTISHINAINPFDEVTPLISSKDSAAYPLGRIGRAVVLNCTKSNEFENRISYEINPRKGFWSGSANWAALSNPTNAVFESQKYEAKISDITGLQNPIRLKSGGRRDFSTVNAAYVFVAYGPSKEYNSDNTINITGGLYRDEIVAYNVEDPNVGAVRLAHIRTNAWTDGVPGSGGKPAVASDGGDFADPFYARPNLIVSSDGTKLVYNSTWSGEGSLHANAPDGSFASSHHLLIDLVEAGLVGPIVVTTTTTTTLSPNPDRCGTQSLADGLIIPMVEFNGQGNYAPFVCDTVNVTLKPHIDFFADSPTETCIPANKCLTNPIVTTGSAADYNNDAKMKIDGLVWNGLNGYNTLADGTVVHEGSGPFYPNIIDPADGKFVQSWGRTFAERELIIGFNGVGMSAGDNSGPHVDITWDQVVAIRKATLTLKFDNVQQQHFDLMPADGVGTEIALHKNIDGYSPYGDPCEISLSGISYPTPCKNPNHGFFAAEHFKRSISKSSDVDPRQLPLQWTEDHDVRVDHDSESGICSEIFDNNCNKLSGLFVGIRRLPWSRGSIGGANNVIAAVEKIALSDNKTGEMVLIADTTWLNYDSFDNPLAGGNKSGLLGFANNQENQQFTVNLYPECNPEVGSNASVVNVLGYKSFADSSVNYNSSWLRVFESKTLFPAAKGLAVKGGHVGPISGTDGVGRDLSFVKLVMLSPLVVLDENDVQNIKTWLELGENRRVVMIYDYVTMAEGALSMPVGGADNARDVMAQFGVKMRPDPQGRVTNSGIWQAKPVSGHPIVDGGGAYNANDLQNKPITLCGNISTVFYGGVTPIDINESSARVLLLGGVACPDYPNCGSESQNLFAIDSSKYNGTKLLSVSLNLELEVCDFKFTDDSDDTTTTTTTTTTAVPEVVLGDVLLGNVSGSGFGDSCSLESSQTKDCLDFVPPPLYKYPDYVVPDVKKSEEVVIESCALVTTANKSTRLQLERNLFDPNRTYGDGSLATIRMLARSKGYDVNKFAPYLRSGNRLQSISYDTVVATGMSIILVDTSVDVNKRESIILDHITSTEILPSRMRWPDQT